MNPNLFIVREVDPKVREFRSYIRKIMRNGSRPFPKNTTSIINRNVNRRVNP